ncbi:MAG TPA: protein-disulfide reductase DsbD domain-containing protein [Candidatus Acidoferrales bacterium]|nr:protein-disulfide reductase DsbD domain-containing protein [Candidatus Acidoferrales bacterium]
MSSTRKRWALGTLVAGCTVFACLQMARARAPQGVPAASSVASPKTYVSIAPVPRGNTFEVAVVVGIQSGFHVNAHKPSEDYLIPTVLTAKLPAGFKDLGTMYPDGVAKKLSFADKPLLVYTDHFTVRAKFTAEPSAPLGKVKFPFTLQYQACNDSVCLPPVRIPVTTTIDVAAAGTKPQQMSPEIFKPSGQR